MNAYMIKVWVKGVVVAVAFDNDWAMAHFPRSFGELIPNTQDAREYLGERGTWTY